MRKLPLAMLIPALLAGCASTDYVDQRVTATDRRIAALVEELAEAKRATAATQAAQDSWLVALQSGMERNTADQDKMAARVAEADRRHGEQQTILAAMTARLNKQEDDARQSGALLRATRDLTTQQENRVAGVEQRLHGLEQAQAGMQSGQLAQQGELSQQRQQLTARLEGQEAAIAQMDSRVSQTADLAGKASAQSEEALALAKGLGARLELVAPMSKEARAAEAPVQTAASEARAAAAGAQQPAATADQAAATAALPSAAGVQAVVAAAPQTATAQAMVDEEARRMARQALEQSATVQDAHARLQARLDAQAHPGPVTPAPVPDDGALRLAEQALAAANQNQARLDGLTTRVEALASAPAPAAVPGPAPVVAAPPPAASATAETPPVAAAETPRVAATDDRLARVEQRLDRVEDGLGQQGQRLTGVEADAAQTGADGKQLRATVAGLAQAHDRLAEEQRQAASLLATLQAQLREAQALQQDREVTLSQISAMAREALERALAAGQLAQGKFVYEMVLSESGYHFALNSAELRPETIAALDDLVLRLNAQNADVFLEIQGHTDSSGSDRLNQDLAKRRALAVRDYLNRNGHVPLHRMSTIALGDSRPLASNDTREGRRQNRRVVIEVLR